MSTNNSSDSKNSSSSEKSSSSKPGPLVINSTSVTAGTAQEDTTLGATGQMGATDANVGATQAWNVKSDAKGNYGSLAIDNTGKWTYTLNNSSSAVQELAEGTSKKDSFTVRVTDSKGASAEKTVSVTVTGTNDAPAISQNSLTIDGDSSSGKVKGTLLYTDPDRGDKHTSNLALKPLVASAGTPDLSASLAQALRMSINDEGENGKGALKWDFALPATAPKLTAGQAVLANYQLSIADNHDGISAPQDLGLLIVGTGSTPKVYSVGAQASLTEGSAAIEQASGVLSGKNFGLEDKGSLSSALVMASWSAGSTIPAAASAVLASALSTSTVPTSRGGESDKSIAWQFSAADPTFDFLAAGETLTLAYRVASAKGEDGKAQIIVITVTGTNDAPVITANDAAATGATQEDTKPTATGNLLASDVDHGATQAWSVPGSDTGAYGQMAVDASTGNWTYTLNNASATVQSLAAGESHNETFTVRVTDDKGAFADQTVIVSVTGTNDAPTVSGAVSGVATEDGAASQVDALANAHDADNNTTLSVVDVPTTLPAGVSYDAATHAFTLDPGNAAYQPLAQGATTPVSVSYNVSDGIATIPASVSWTVTGSNDAPIAFADTGAQKNNEVKSYAVLDNDTDVDHAAVLSLAGASVAAGSGAVHIVGGQIQFDPGQDFKTLRLNDTKVVNVDYTVADEHGAQANSTLAVTVIGTNTPPTAVADSLATNEDTPLQFSAAALLANDTDPDPLDTKSIVSVTSPRYGTLVDGGNGNYTYTPGLNYNGPDSFSYTMRDAAGEQSSTHVNLNVNPVNDAPVAVNDSNALTVTPLASQIHSNVVHWVNWTSATGVANGPPGTIYGTIDLGNSQTVDVTYTGEYYFAYTNGGTNFYNLTNGTVPAGTYTSAAVANGPNGSSDIIGLALANSPRSLTFSQPVDNLFFAVVSLNNNGYIFDQDFQVASYGPGYWGNGTLTRQALGNGTYEVVGTGEPHGVLAIDGTVSKLTWTSAGTEYWNGFTVGTYGKAQTGTATGNVLTNDSDVEHDPLAVASVNGVAMTGNSVTLTLASGAKLNVNKDGAYLYDENAAFGSLGQGQSKQDSFTYTVSDGHGGTSTATAAITVTGVNDAPVITSSAQTGAVQAAHPTTTFSGNMTADNQFDIYISADDSQLGTYLGSGNSWGSPFGFNAASLTQGTTNYIHVVAKNWGGPGGILGSFTLSDSNFAFTNGSTVENTTAADWKVSLTGFGSNYSTPVNEGTNGVGPWGQLGGGISSSSNWMWNYYSTNSGDYNTEYFSMKISPVLPAATGQLTASDLDNGATQSWSVFGSASGTYGSLAVNPSTGAWTYTLDNNSSAVLSLAAGAADYDHFTVRVTDDHGATADQTVTVKVTGINDAPTAVNDTTATNEDTAVPIAVLANDKDPDVGDTMTLVSVSNAQHGALAMSGSNVVYTPAANYNGADSFTYTMRDAAGATSSATVNLMVNPVSDTYVLSSLATNGSFEQQIGTNYLWGGSTDMPGWTVTGTDVDRVSGWQPGDGAYSLDLNGFHPGGVQQVLQTTPGVQYTVGFALSKNPGSPTGSETLQVSAGGSSQSYTFNALNSDLDMKWSQQTFTFTASAASTTLSFASGDAAGANDAWGPALDEVVVFANKTINNFGKGAGGDVLQLHDLLTSVSAPHDTTAFSGGYLRFQPSGSNTLVQIDSNGGGDAYLTVATLIGQSLAQADTANYVL